MLLDLIKLRKSIRKFKDIPVEKEKIDYIMECGRLSPSACNNQPYRFVIIQGDFKKKFDEEVFSGIYSFCSFIKSAPLIVAIVREKNKFVANIGSKIQDTDFSLIDIGICGQQIVLAATELGLGSLWVGWFDKKKANKMIGVKKNQSVEMLIAIGYKNEEPSERRKKSFDEIVNVLDKI